MNCADRMSVRRFDIVQGDKVCHVGIWEVLIDLVSDRKCRVALERLLIAYEISLICLLEQRL